MCLTASLSARNATIRSAETAERISVPFGMETPGVLYLMGVRITPTAKERGGNSMRLSPYYFGHLLTLRCGVNIVKRRLPRASDCCRRF